jgi:hypothetical protein
MSGGRPAVDKHRPIIEDATRAGEPDSASRLPLRRDVNSAAIGVSLAEIAEIPSKAPGGNQRFALQGFAGSIHALPDRERPARSDS